MMVKDAISMNHSIVLPVILGHNRTWEIRDWPHLLMLKDAIAINDSSVILGHNMTWKSEIGRTW